MAAKNEWLKKMGMRDEVQTVTSTAGRDVKTRMVGFPEDFLGEGQEAPSLVNMMNFFNTTN